MTNRFAQTPNVNIQRSAFNLSFAHKTAFEVDNIIPFMAEEVLPGDTFNVKANIFARLNTPQVPIMDNMYLETYFFECPYRILWDNWKKFNGEQIDPRDRDWETNYP